ncbi:MAG: peptidoglycan DD-metalloendopeptidase family protein [Vicinamibacteraceae bacterium]|nr:peptidoglycan DD-metalloendopeptidase family protein [Vicinamibacteraceae bacterium]
MRWVGLLLVCALVAAPAPSDAQETGPLPVPAASTLDRQRYRAMAGRAEGRLKTLEAEARALAGQQRTLLVRLRTLEVERQKREAALERATALVAEAEAERDATAGRIAAIERQIEQERPDVARRLARLHATGPLDSVAWLASASSVREAGRRYRVLAMLASADRARFATFEARLSALATEEAALAARTSSLAAARSEADAARRAAAAAEAAQAALVRDVAAREELARQLAAELAEAQRALEAAIAGTDSDAAPQALPLAAFRGALAWPVAGRVIEGFGPRRQSRFGTAVFRNGIGIDAPEGRTVRAVHEGRVAYAQPFTGFGRLVILDHGGGAFTLYGHLGSLYVTKGQVVGAGTALGAVGRTPEGGHALYFEVRVDQRPVDPLQWLKRPTASR